MMIFSASQRAENNHPVHDDRRSTGCGHDADAVT
jgi:hypothetical protein